MKTYHHPHHHQHQHHYLYPHCQARNNSVLAAEWEQVHQAQVEAPSSIQSVEVYMYICEYLYVSMVWYVMAFMYDRDSF